MFFPYKDDNPTEIAPVVTIGLIAVNVLAFLYEVTHNLDLVALRAGAIPWEIAHFENLPESPGMPPPLTLLTSMFLHGDWMHLAGNMWFLWLFGNNIEDALGHVRFFFFYLLTGIAAALAHVVFDASSVIPMVGASGAISGVMGAYILLYPHARVRALLFLFYFITTVALPAWVYLGVWFLMQFWMQQEGVAWMAHAGGFLVGLGLVKLFLIGRPKPTVGVRVRSRRPL